MNIMKLLFRSHEQMSAEMIDFMVDEHNIDIEPDLQRRVKVGYLSEE